MASTPLLSKWVAESVINLSASDYPIWSVTISLPAETTFEYKFVKCTTPWQVVWAKGGSRTVTTASTGKIIIKDPFHL